jgi:hypothetical protein
MEFLGYLVRCLIELAALGRLLTTNSLNFLALYMKSRTALTAEVLFLRKQLACYQERKVVVIPEYPYATKTSTGRCLPKSPCMATVTSRHVSWSRAVGVLERLAPPTAFVPQRRPPREGIALRHSSAKRGSCWSRLFPDSGGNNPSRVVCEDYPISVSEYYLGEIRN